LNRRAEVYLDESGDLGFCTGGSRFFVVAAMATTDPVSLRRLVSRANRKTIHSKEHAFEHKFNRSTRRTREYFLKIVSESDCYVSWRAFDKSRESGKTALQQRWLYEFLCTNALGGLFSRISAGEFRVVVNKRTSRGPPREDLDSRIEMALAKTHAGYLVPGLRIAHVDSRSNEALQVHDFVVGSVFQSLERRDQSYLEIIAPKIVDGSIVY